MSGTGEVSHPCPAPPPPPPPAPDFDLRRPRSPATNSLLVNNPGKVAGVRPTPAGGTPEGRPPGEGGWPDPRRRGHPVPLPMPGLCLSVFWASGSGVGAEGGLPGVGVCFLDAQQRRRAGPRPPTPRPPRPPPTVLAQADPGSRGWGCGLWARGGTTASSGPRPCGQPASPRGEGRAAGGRPSGGGGQDITCLGPPGAGKTPSQPAPPLPR